MQTEKMDLRQDAGQIASSEPIQVSTFIVAGRLYGIDVTKVQEIVRPNKLTMVPHAPHFVRGLLNLRGQVATAIGLRELFGLEVDKNVQSMCVVCRVGSSLLSLLVDDISDVMKVDQSTFEKPPPTIQSNVRQFMSGVCQLEQSLLSLLDVERILAHLSQTSVDAHQ